MPARPASAPPRSHLVARWKREWTCKVHDRPLPIDYDEDGEVVWDWPIYGCTCNGSARWVPAEPRVLEFIHESPINWILQEYYLPAMTEALSQPMFLRLLEREAK